MFPLRLMSGLVSYSRQGHRTAPVKESIAPFQTSSNGFVPTLISSIPGTSKLPVLTLNSHQFSTYRIRILFRNADDQLTVGISNERAILSSSNSVESTNFRLQPLTRFPNLRTLFFESTIILHRTNSR